MVSSGWGQRLNALRRLEALPCPTLWAVTRCRLLLCPDTDAMPPPSCMPGIAMAVCRTRQSKAFVCLCLSACDYRGVFLLVVNPTILVPPCTPLPCHIPPDHKHYHLPTVNLLLHSLNTRPDFLNTRCIPYLRSLYCDAACTTSLLRTGIVTLSVVGLFLQRTKLAGICAHI